MRDFCLESFIFSSLFVHCAKQFLPYRAHKNKRAAQRVISLRLSLKNQANTALRAMITFSS